MAAKSFKNLDLFGLQKYSFSDNRVAGIYFLFNKNKLMYIGTSSDIFQRVAIHYSKYRGFIDSYSYIKINKRGQRYNLERKLIKRYNPPYNINYKERMQFFNTNR